jgi:hypothetical protein
MNYCYNGLHLILSRLMLSPDNWDQISRVPLLKYIKISGYCYHSVNVISLSLPQSDNIKRLSLHSWKDLLIQVCLSKTSLLIMSYVNLFAKVFSFVRSESIFDISPKRTTAITLRRNFWDEKLVLFYLFFFCYFFFFLRWKVSFRFFVI